MFLNTQCFAGIGDDRIYLLKLLALAVSLNVCVKEAEHARQHVVNEVFSCADGLYRLSFVLSEHFISHLLGFKRLEMHLYWFYVGLGYFMYRR